ncbi:MAG: O-antigen translocase [Marinilabiliaceae bacterium]|nr:O-antigen translocase [Marinilabiliaceae bacterium]
MEKEQCGNNKQKDIIEVELAQEIGCVDNTVEEKSSFRQIFKATSLFGGVQVFNVIIGIVKVKIVAVLLGTAGVGIMGLLNAPRDLIMTVTGLGIAFSAVRDISQAHGQNDKFKMSEAIFVLRRWSWFTGLLGAVLTIAVAPLLSEWTFGNKDYSWAFVWLSVTMLLNSISSGQGAVLQGTRRLKDMANSGVTGSLLGLITSVPLFYFYGIKGIVPALIVSSVTSLIRTWYFVRKVEVEKVHLTLKEVWHKGGIMAKLGISMTLAGFIASLSRYILNAFISNYGSVDQVGLYNAGWGVLGQYTGLVFAAMATDYFPRLSSIQADNKKVKELVGQQAEIALLILVPMITLLTVFMPFVIRVLYTSSFLPVVMFATLTLLGMQLKAVSWAMGYVFLAKGDGKLFLILEIISGAIILLLNLLFYYLYGLNGLGVSFIISYLIGALLAFGVLKNRYQFGFSRHFYQLFIISSVMIVLAYLTIHISNDIYKYSLGVIVFGVSFLYALVRLNKLMDIREIIVRRFKK